MIEKIKIAESKTDLNPTEAQKKAGNYKKGKVTIKGFKISIENPKGSLRSGKDRDGNSWEIKMPFPYGYFNSTIGKDGDQIDVYIGNYIENDFDVYIIDQIDPITKAFDEHKVMFGFKNKTSAKEGYLSCYEEGWKGFGNITSISLNKFKKWINDPSLIKYPANKLSLSQTMDIKNEEGRLTKVRLFGEVESGKTLNSLQEQAGDLDSFDEIAVEIASPGGSVAEGLEIMLWFDQLTQMGKKVITVVVANAYSIASLIMLAANYRLISKHGKVMVHNPMVPELKYVNANELEKHIEDLRNLEEYMYQLYEIFTGLEKDKIKSLMDEETYLSPKEAVDLGFADMVVDIKPRSFEMTTNTNKQINMSKTINILNRVIGMVNGDEFVNQTYTDTKSGAEVEIHQTDPSTYKTGDRTSLENGEIVLSDGAKITIEDFVITDIDRSASSDEEANFNEGAAPVKDGEAVVDEPAVEKPAEAVPAKAEEGGEAMPPVEPKTEPAKVIEKTESTITTKEVQNAEIKENFTWEFSVVNDTFAEGDKVEFKPMEGEDEPHGVGAGEFTLEDGRKILTDSDSIIRFIKPAPAESPEVPANDPEVEAKKEAEMKGDLQAKVEELEAKNKELEAKLGEIENKLKEETDDVKAKLEKVNEYQDLAAEAIDSIASNVQSGFKPKARASVKTTNSNKSIFAQMKAKRGL